ncbi:hypothetical protein JRQ81_017609 [Phrynocephalus forsythii]|uniref:Uncharacterized protein n=1 Tax=Phrynocephalus forsythii TaxID=171643 RepID=A0A9Q0XR82_9SAUR|nr:hypothetical protein JRQ81_017609 [Phrynocephalus forsythii]
MASDVRSTTATPKPPALVLTESRGIEGVHSSAQVGAQSPDATRDEPWSHAFENQTSKREESLMSGVLQKINAYLSPRVGDERGHQKSRCRQGKRHRHHGSSSSSSPAQRHKSKCRSKKRQRHARMVSSSSDTDASTISSSASSQLKRQQRGKPKPTAQRRLVSNTDTIAGLAFQNHALQSPTDTTPQAVNQQAQLPDSPAAMHHPLTDDSDTGAASQKSHRSTLSISRHFETDMPDKQSSTPMEDFKHYSQMIHKIAQVMGLQVQLPAASDLCKFFGHLHNGCHAKQREVPLQHHPEQQGSSEARPHWQASLLPCLILLESTELSVRNGGVYPSPPAHFSGLHKPHYGRTKGKAQASYMEVLSLIDYQMITSMHITNAASKQLMTAIHLRRHAWLRTSSITDDARNRIEDSPFDGEGFFATSTDVSLDNIQNMRKAAKSYTQQGDWFIAQTYRTLIFTSLYPLKTGNTSASR